MQSTLREFVDFMQNHGWLLLLAGLGGLGGGMIFFHRSQRGTFALSSGIFWSAIILVFGTYGMLSFQPTRAQTEAWDGERIAWISDENEALAVARGKHLPLIVDFTADWCVACHELDAMVFSDPRVVARLRNFVPLRLDVTVESTAKAKLDRYGAATLPAIVFVNAEGRLMESPRIYGLVSVEEFLETLQSF